MKLTLNIHRHNEIYWSVECRSPLFSLYFPSTRQQRNILAILHQTGHSDRAPHHRVPLLPILLSEEVSNPTDTKTYNIPNTIAGLHNNTITLTDIVILWFCCNGFPFLQLTQWCESVHFHSHLIILSKITYITVQIYTYFIYVLLIYLLMYWHFVVCKYNDKYSCKQRCGFLLRMQNQGKMYILYNFGKKSKRRKE